MTWVKFDDLAPEHPKLAALGNLAPLAGWLWFAATCYCARHLTDGVIARAALRRLWVYDLAVAKTPAIADAMTPDSVLPQQLSWQLDADDLIARLIEARLLDVKDEQFLRVHDFLDYNFSKREVLKHRADKRKAGQAGGTAKAIADAKARATTDAIAADNPSGMPPSYSRPTPDRTTSPLTRGARKRKPKIPWETADTLAKVQAEFPALDVAAELIAAKRRAVAAGLSWDRKRLVNWLMLADERCRNPAGPAAAKINDLWKDQPPGEVKL